MPDRPETVPLTWKVGSASPPDQSPAVARPLAMMPGAPPVNVLSFAEMATVPFAAKVNVEPTTVKVSCVPAAKGLVAYVEPSSAQLPLFLRQH